MGKIINRVRRRRAIAEAREIDRVRAQVQRDYDDIFKAHMERNRQFVVELQKPMFVRLVEWWVRWRS